MEKKNKTLIVIGAIILLVVLSQTPNNPISNIINPTPNGGGANTGTNPQADMLSVECFGQDKNPINCKGTDTGTSSPFSIVNSAPGVYYIRLTTTLTSKAPNSLTCNLGTLTPPVFNSAVIKTQKTLLSGGQTAWSSDLISTAQFEVSPQPTVFTTTATCTSGLNSTTKTGPLSITITSDSTGGSDFDIGLGQGGIPTEYCGDLVCQVNEDPTSCPADCAVAVGNVKFRTTDLSYVSGSAIGYSATCGTALTRYGYGTSSGTLSGNCASQTTLSSFCGTSPVKLFAIPGTETYLFKPTETDRLCVCKTTATGGAYNILKYLTTDSDANLVDSSAASFDTIKEVAC